MIKSLAVIFVFILLAGCAKPDIKSKSALVTFVTKEIKVHDTAFVYIDNNRIDIEVYSAGNLIFELSSNAMVCINSLCLSDDEFSAKYLSEYYPKRVIQKIVSKKPLDIKDIKTTQAEDGFMQSAYEQNRYDISYIVKKDEVFFKDSINRVIIKIKDLD